MAFPVGWNRQCAIVIDHTKVTANQTALPILITEVNLPDEMKTSGGGNAAQSDGGDIRFSTDTAGTTQLACEVVVWTQDATPANAKAEIWVPVDVLTGSDVTIYVWYNAGGGLSQPAAGASFGSQAVWGSSYVAVYHLQTIGAATSGTTPDSSSSGNNLTNSGSSSVTASAAKFSNGASFAGANYTLTKTSTTNLPSGSAYRSIECWFKRNADNSAQQWFGYGDNGGTGHRIAFLWQNDGNIYIECATFFNAFAWTADTNWHHILVTLSTNSSPTVADLVMYFDGVLKTSSGTSNGTLTNSTNTEIRLSGLIGAGTPPVLPFNGYVDEARISNVQRSATWISTQYNNQNSPSTFATPGTPSGGGTPADATVTTSDSISLSDAVLALSDYIPIFSDSISLSDGLTFETSGFATVLAADDILAFADSAVANFGIHTPPSLRGNIDYDQIRVSARSGDGPKLLTLKGPFVPGNTVVFDADGNLIDAGHS